MRHRVRKGLVVLLACLAIPFTGAASSAPADVPAPDVTPESQPLLRPFLSRLPPGLYSTAPYTLSTLNRVNYHRDLAGVAPLALQTQISLAAQAHADYLIVNNYAGHDETASAPGFTGQWAWDRMAHQGYNYSTAGEVIAFGEDAQAGVDALITAIYHRFALLDSGYTEAGIGDAADPNYVYKMCQVINLGRPNGSPAATGAVAIYPADGQTEVPTTFDSDTESPDPAPNQGLVGYPASIQFSAEQSVTLSSFTMHVNGGGQVAAILLTPGSNANMPSNKPNYALIPISPLQPNTTYDVSFTATVNGAPFNAAWSFTTVPPAVLTVTPSPATFAMGQTGELVITGGSGGYSVSWIPGGKFTLKWSTDGTTMLITPIATGTATITLTDTQTKAVAQVTVTIVNGPAPLSGSRALGTGWNLLALPLTPASTTASTVLGGIINKTVSAWKWAGSTWAVLIPSDPDGGAQYAAGKGFSVLQTLAAGEGFWINAAASMTFTYTGSTPANTGLALTSGWNLVGLKTTKTIPVGDIAYPAGVTVVSLWVWTGSTWAVTLPQANDGGAGYAATKGFPLLQTISPGEGFWANVQ